MQGAKCRLHHVEPRCNLDEESYEMARAAIESAGNVDDLAAVFARHNQATCDTSNDAFLCAAPEFAAIPQTVIVDALPAHIITPMEAVSGIQIPMLF